MSDLMKPDAKWVHKGSYYECKLCKLQSIVGSSPAIKALVDAAKKLCNLPNVEKRMGPWKDVNGSFEEIRDALAPFLGCEGKEKV